MTAANFSVLLPVYAGDQPEFFFLGRLAVVEFIDERLNVHFLYVL